VTRFDPRRTTGSAPRSPRHPTPDDVTAEMLRRALAREAAGVHPSDDGLQRILAATRSSDQDSGIRRGAVRPGPFERARWAGVGRWLPVLAAAAAVTLLVGGLGAVRLGVLSTNGLTSVIGPAGHDRSAPAVVQPLPVYLLERQNRRWALVREFIPTTLTAPSARLTSALQLAVAGTGTDPDHTSAWAQRKALGRGGQGLVEASSSPTAVTITLSAAELGRTGSGDEQPAEGGSGPPAALAIQQLVWTATAVTGLTSPVRILASPGGTALFGTVPLDRDFSRSTGADDPRAPVWVSSVVNDQRLAAGAAVVRGDAITTGTGTVGWTLQGADGAPLASGTSALHRDDGSPARAGERGVWELSEQLRSAGSYLLAVSQSWPRASVGDRPWSDTKTLIVS
jgi:hypothetical protein